MSGLFHEGNPMITNLVTGVLLALALALCLCGSLELASRDADSDLARFCLRRD